MNDSFLHPPKSRFKKLFIGSPLGQILKVMNSKAVPKGLKLSECEQGIGGKNLPIHYLPELGPVHGALEKKKGQILQVDIAYHQEQDECCTMGVWDSRAVFTARAHSHSRMQADGA